ncbi:hypothetical protein HDU92_008496 [Lobulomyces angularis]|nr:hypothetical protein HDU92_008496 [Lobulomyces angularis]
MGAASILFGTLLGDGYGERLKIGTRFIMQQEDSNLSDYGYCKYERPKLERRVVKGGKIRFYFRLRTYSYSSLNWIHDLFYYQGIKIVPFNIGDFLTPQALAIWIMDDGTLNSSGMR